MSDLIERVAEVLHGRVDDRSWTDPRIEALTRNEWRDLARAAIAALDRLAGEGWRLVPVEPTEAMLAAGVGYTDFVLPDAIGKTPSDYMLEMRTAWSAMLAAAPSLSKDD